MPDTLARVLRKLDDILAQSGCQGTCVMIATLSSLGMTFVSEQQLMKLLKTKSAGGPCSSSRAKRPTPSGGQE